MGSGEIVRSVSLFICVSCLVFGIGASCGIEEGEPTALAGVVALVFIFSLGSLIGSLFSDDA